MWEPIKWRDGLYKFFFTLIAEKTEPKPIKGDFDRAFIGVYFYPSIGIKGYPYTGWEYKYKEYAWNTLGDLGEVYHRIYRFLRERYKWSPEIADNLTITRLLRIYNEAVEDAPKNEDLEGFEE